MLVNRLHTAPALWRFLKEDVSASVDDLLWRHLRQMQNRVMMRLVASRVQLNCSHPGYTVPSHFILNNLHSLPKLQIPKLQ